MMGTEYIFVIEKVQYFLSTNTMRTLEEVRVRQIYIKVKKEKEDAHVTR